MERKSIVDLNTQIFKEKNRYLEYIEKHKNKHLFIYGAGKQAMQVFQFLKENNVHFEGFCVTDKLLNKKSEMGIPVYQVDELPYTNNQIAFVSGIRDSLNIEIVNILKKHGYTNFLPSSSLIRYLGKYGYQFFINPMIEITTKLGCAVNCKYCPQDIFLKEYLKNGSSDRVLSLENYKICIDKLPKETLVEFAGFTEPFFNPQCLAMIQYAVQKGHKVNMFTTLRGVTTEIINELIHIQFEEFVLHVPDNEGYANIPIDTQYIELLKQLIDAKKPNGDNYIDYACTQGTVLDSIKTILNEKVRIYVVLNDRAGNLKDSNLYAKRHLKGKLRCELSQDINHNVLLPDGRVILCSNDWGMKHVLGNLINQTYEEIIYGEKAEAIREKMSMMEGEVLCRNCFQAVNIYDERL